MFHRPPPTDWRALLTVRRQTRYATDASIASGGDLGDRDIHVVMEGTVRLSLATREGREQVLFYLPPGSLFGEQAALGKSPVFADLVAVADEPCVVGQIATADMTALLARRPELIRDWMQMTGEKTSLFLAAAARAAFGSSRAQLTTVLLALGRRRKRVSISQERLARLCGTTRVTIAAQLHRLADEGLIRMKRNTIEIKDGRRMGRIAT